MIQTGDSSTAGMAVGPVRLFRIFLRLTPLGFIEQGPEWDGCNLDLISYTSLDFDQLLRPFGGRGSSILTRAG